jgi:hypothetical protein
MQYHYIRTVKNTGTGWFLVTVTAPTRSLVNAYQGDTWAHFLQETKDVEEMNILSADFEKGLNLLFLEQLYQRPSGCEREVERINRCVLAVGFDQLNLSCFKLAVEFGQLKHIGSLNEGRKRWQI